MTRRIPQPAVITQPSDAPGGSIARQPLTLALLLALASGCNVPDEVPAHMRNEMRIDVSNGTSDFGRASLALEQISLDECVLEHVERAGGDAEAVTSLRCPVAEPSSCDGVAPDLSALGALTRLRELDLTGRCVADLSVIAALTRLEHLELGHNAVTNLRPLGSQKQLRYLGLADNPIVGASGGIRRDPFSELPELQELVLDGNPLDNVLPLASAPKLRKLSLRRVDNLGSLQSLAALRGLRSLHIDGMVVSDLTALGEITELEELSAEGTLVNSAEPLRALVAQHRLRAVSLRGTCVRSCDALTGANHDCSDPQPESACYVPEEAFTVFGNQIAVPLPMVERFAPGDLPVWSREQLTSAFEAARAAPHIDWRNAASNCDLRARQTLELLRDGGFPEATQVVSYGNLRPLASDAPFGFYWFDFHIAVAVRARAGADADPAFFVLDPTLDPAKPMALADWFARQIDSAGSSLDFACQPYTQLHSIGPCTDAVDADGNFRVDPPALLRGAVCPDASCVPHF